MNDVNVLRDVLRRLGSPKIRARIEKLILELDGRDSADTHPVRLWPSRHDVTGLDVEAVLAEIETLRSRGADEAVVALTRWLGRCAASSGR